MENKILDMNGNPVVTDKEIKEADDKLTIDPIEEMDKAEEKILGHLVSVLKKEDSLTTKQTRFAIENLASLLEIIRRRQTYIISDLQNLVNIMRRNGQEYKIGHTHLGLVQDILIEKGIFTKEEIDARWKELNEAAKKAQEDAIKLEEEQRKVNGEEAVEPTQEEVEMTKEYVDDQEYIEVLEQTDCEPCGECEDCKCEEE